MIETAELRIFARVATSLSFASTARALAMTPSAVSKAVARLEAQLATKLLVRTTRSVRLTESGSLFLERASRILQELEACEREIVTLDSRPRGRLRLELPSTLGARRVVPLLPMFCDRYPQLELDVRLDDRYIDLVGEGSDAALRVGELADSRLVGRKVGATRVVTVAAPAFARAHSRLRRPEQLDARNCLQFRSASSGRCLPWRFIQRGRARPFSLPPVHTFSNSEALVASAVAGLGVTQVLDFAVQRELAAGTLVELFPELGAAGPPIWFVCPPERAKLPKVKELSDFLAAELGSP